MAGSARLLFSTLVLGIVFAGGMALPPLERRRVLQRRPSLGMRFSLSWRPRDPMTSLLSSRPGLQTPAASFSPRMGTSSWRSRDARDRTPGSSASRRVVRYSSRMGCRPTASSSAQSPGSPTSPISMASSTRCSPVAIRTGVSTPNGLYRLDGAGGAELLADISAFIREHPVAEKPRDFDTDGQPYAMLAMGDAFWVTEGNSNQVLRVGLDGTVARVADLSQGHPIPTGIAPAPGWRCVRRLLHRTPRTRRGVPRL